MKRVVIVLVVVCLCSVGWGQSASSSSSVDVDSALNSTTEVGVVAGDVTIDNSSGATGGTAVAGGGQGGNSDASSAAVSVNEDGDVVLQQNFEASGGRTGLVVAQNPYLPYWSHGGWGILPPDKVVFYNGPSEEATVYERVVEPNERGMGSVYSSLDHLSYEGPIELLMSAFSWIDGSKRFYYEGKGFEISNSIVRKPRPKGKPLLVFVSSGGGKEDRIFLNHGYIPVNSVGIEGNIRNGWDDCYNVAIAETIPWDVDALVLSGGMKGVTVGSSNSSGVAGGTSQKNFSLTATTAGTEGIVEGAGKGVVRATAYRFDEKEWNRRNTFAKYLKGDLKYSDLRPTGYSPKFSAPSTPIQDKGVREQQDTNRKKKTIKSQEELGPAAFNELESNGVLEAVDPTIKGGAGG